MKAGRHTPSRSRVTELISWLERTDVENPEELLAESTRIHSVFTEELADRLTPKINELLSAMPAKTLDEKRKVAQWLGSVLRPLDLGVRCPKTGKIGILIANHGNDAVVGRFQINIDETDGSRRVTLSSVALPPITLAPRSEGGVEQKAWKSRVASTPDSNHCVDH